MATLSYTLYNYANVTPELLGLPTTSSLTDAVLTIVAHGPFPNDWFLNENGDGHGGELDGELNMWIDGVSIGRAFFGPPGSDSSGYFEDTDGGGSVVTATIPRDVWQSIIADGHMQIEFGLGLDAESLARADDYIRVEASWTETAAQYSGSPFDDFMQTNGPAFYLGLGGNDTIEGSASYDTIHGGDGNDLIHGNGGGDIIRGNSGDDTADGGDGDDTVMGNDGHDVLAGGLGSDRLKGDAGNDRLDGGQGIDYLWGGDGDDTLAGGTGGDHLFGGAGADTFLFSTALDGPQIDHVYDFNRSAGDKLIFEYEAGQDLGGIYLHHGPDGSTISIGNLSVVVSGAFDLTLDDVVFQETPALAAAPLALAPHEMIWGTEGVDNLDAMDGPAASIHALGGNDYVTGSLFGDQILGDEGNDTLFGADGDDRVSGNGGNDEVSGGEGDDIVLGNIGNDNLFGDTGNDQVRGGGGLDNLSGGQGDDFLWGGTDRDWLYGDDGTDRLWGEAGNDDLDGGRGTDYLFGGDGNDRLLGGKGENHLFGGAGADQFVFAFADGAGTQHVYDFNRAEGDKLIYIQDFDQVVDTYDVHVGKDGTVVTIDGTSIVLSGVFDFQQSDITFQWDSDWPF